MSEPLAVFLSWKDSRHPAAGGAEVVHLEWSHRLIADGYRVIHLVPGFPGCEPRDNIDGIEIRRFGRNVLSFYAAARYYRHELRDRTDLLVDTFNCFGSFALTHGARGKSVFVIHHIQDRMWFYQRTFYGVPRALMPAVGLFGYLVEKMQLLLLARLYKGPAITVSRSTADELTRYGFKPQRIHIAHNGCSSKPLASLADSLPKFERFTVLMIGPRQSKRPMHTLKAFEIFQRTHPDTALVVVGWGTEDDRLRAYAYRRGIRNVTVEGRIPEARKRELLQQCHVLCTSPVKEGWGMVVNEANAMGTPVIAYDVPGLRDALQFENGLLCRPRPEAMADALATVHEMWRQRPDAYELLRRKALQSSRQWSFDRSYNEFRAAVEG